MLYIWLQTTVFCEFCVNAYINVNLWLQSTFNSFNKNILNFCLLVIGIKSYLSSPDWCGSVDWMLAYETKGRKFSPSQGTSLGCGPGSQLGACGRQPIHISFTCQCFFPSFCLSLPLSLIINQSLN